MKGHSSLLMALLALIVLVGLASVRIVQHRSSSSGRIVCRDKEDRRYTQGAIIVSGEQRLRCDATGRWLPAVDK